MKLAEFRLLNEDELEAQITDEVFAELMAEIEVFLQGSTEAVILSLSKNGEKNARYNLVSYLIKETSDKEQLQEFRDYLQENWDTKGAFSNLLYHFEDAVKDYFVNGKGYSQSDNLNIFTFSLLKCQIASEDEYSFLLEMLWDSQKNDDVKNKILIEAAKNIRILDVRFWLFDKMNEDGFEECPGLKKIIRRSLNRYDALVYPMIYHAFRHYCGNSGWQKVLCSLLVLILSFSVIIATQLNMLVLAIVIASALFVIAIQFIWSD